MASAPRLMRCSTFPSAGNNGYHRQSTTDADTHASAYTLPSEDENASNAGKASPSSAPSGYKQQHGTLKTHSSLPVPTLTADQLSSLKINSADDMFTITGPLGFKVIIDTAGFIPNIAHASSSSCSSANTQQALQPPPSSASPSQPTPSSSALPPSSSQHQPQRPQARPLKRQETEIFFNGLTVSETAQRLSQLGVKAWDFVDTPLPPSTNPVPEWFDPLSTLSHYDASLVIPNRTRPFQGKVLRRLLDLGWLKDADRGSWLEIDRKSLRAYDELCAKRWIASGEMKLVRPPGIRGNPGEYPYMIPRSYRSLPKSALNPHETWVSMPSDRARHACALHAQRGAIMTEKIFRRGVRQNEEDETKEMWDGIVAMGKRMSKQLGKTVRVMLVDGDADAGASPGGNDAPVIDLFSQQKREIAAAGSSSAATSWSSWAAGKKRAADDELHRDIDTTSSPSTSENTRCKKRRLTPSPEASSSTLYSSPGSNTRPRIRTPAFGSPSSEPPKQFPCPISAYDPKDHAYIRQAQLARALGNTALGRSMTPPIETIPEEEEEWEVVRREGSQPQGKDDDESYAMDVDVATPIVESASLGGGGGFGAFASGYPAAADILIEEDMGESQQESQSQGEGESQSQGTGTRRPLRKKAGLKRTETYSVI